MITRFITPRMLRRCTTTTVLALAGAVACSKAADAPAKTAVASSGIALPDGKTPSLLVAALDSNARARMEVRTGELKDADASSKWTAYVNDGSVRLVDERVVMGDSSTRRVMHYFTGDGHLVSDIETRNQLAMSGSSSPMRQFVLMSMEFAGDSLVKSSKTVNGEVKSIEPFEITSAKRHADLFARGGVDRAGRISSQTMTDFETLGAFYLGKRYDVATRQRSEDYVLYDAKDLTTHAVIVGMTGSGKTGLGLAIIEEALIDRIPVIAVDPKGDLGNLALQFPELSAEEFRPWVDAQQAATAGMSVDAFAEQQAQLWKDGLAGWGEDATRVRRLHDAADVAIYTPGSTAGRPISILQAFSAPPQVVRNDAEGFQDRVEATASSLLALLNIDADPITSREHVLLANLLSNAWSAGRDLDLAGLIGAIQAPPFATIGVMPLDSVFPPRDRMALAMKLNNLLAAPGFQVWMQGESLSAANLLHSSTGKPRCSVISIAHLSDEERMFFMTMLLAEVLAWMRTQPGTGSLRAILYIDELFGYMPPVANPSSKMLLLTLLKQARAFGLGVVLATQNPVDLDYKGLANTGTWFIGRMQTERDKARVMEGLEGASNGGAFDKDAMEKTIAGLDKRVFLMHSVHEVAPITFETRWTLSYLAGPMTREQIKAVTQQSNAVPAGVAVVSANSSADIRVSANSTDTPRAPVVSSDIPQYFIPPQATTASVRYNPAVIGIADITYTSVKYSITEQRRVTLVTSLCDGPIAMDWGTAQRLDIDASQLESAPRNGASFGAVPKVAMTPKSYSVWAEALQKWLSTNETVNIFRSPSTKQISTPGETERDFRIRLQVASRESRDAKIEALRGKYATKLSTLQERIRKAQQGVEREQSEASQAKVGAMISVGSAVLGAIFGRGKIGTINKVGTAARAGSRVARQTGDVTRAGDTVEALQAQYQDVENALQGEIDALGATFDAAAEQLDEIAVKAKAGDIAVQLVALAWAPNAPAQIKQPATSQ